MKMIYLDMDGTIADLYADAEWLSKLRAFDTTPYATARKLVDEEVLLSLIGKGYTLGIVSWLAGYHNNKDYDKAVRQVKKEWLRTNYPRVEFKEIHIVKFGTPKYTVVNDKYGILVDDELKNRKSWKGLAIEPLELLEL